MNAQDLLSRLSQFRGYGDYKKAKFLYIGIEEASPFKTAKELDEFLDSKSKNKPWELHRPGKPNGKTERAQATLSMKLLGLAGSVDDYDFCQEHEFCSNIYPIGAPRESASPKQYLELFGTSKQEAQALMHSERITLLEAMIQEFLHRDKGRVIVFGCRARDFLKEKGNWERLKIEIDGKKTFEKRRPSPLEYSGDKRFWFVGHPSFGWFNDMAIDEIIKIINRSVM